MKYFLIMTITLMTLVGCGGAEERKAVYLEKAQQSFEAGNLDKARVELKNVLQIDPKDARAYFQLGEIFELKKEYQKAFTNYLKATEYGPENLEYHAKIGTYYLMLAGDLEESIKKRDFILSKNPDNIYGRLLDASILFKQGNSEEATKISQDIYKSQPSNVQNALFLSSIYLGNKSYKEAVDVLNSCIAKNRKVRALHNALADAYLKYGKLDLAESIYKTAIEQDPDEFTNHLKLAVFYKIINEPLKAEAVLRDAIATKKDDPDRVIALVDYIQQTKGNRAAIEELERITVEYPYEGKYRVRQASLLIVENELDKAKVLLKSTIAEFEDESYGVQAAVLLADIYIQQRNINDAEEVINNAIKISPNDSEVNYRKAKIQVINKKYEEAIISLRAVIKDAPENVDAYLLQAAAHIVNGRQAQADEIIDRAYENNKANAEGLIKLAKYHARSGSDDKLEKIINHYLSIDSNDYDALSYKCGLLNKKKMFQESWPYASKMIELYPDRPNGYIQSLPYLLIEGKRKEAINILESGYAKVNDNMQILELLVSLYIGDKMYDMAEAKVNSALQSNGGTAELYMLLAKVQWLSGNKEQAKSNLLKASSLNPDWNEPYIKMANIYKTENNEQKAIDILKQGLTRIAADYSLSLSLAKIYEEAGDFEAAINVYTIAYEKYDDNVILMNNLAMLLAERRNDEDSLRHARNIADKLKNTNQPVVLDTVGWVYYKIGNYTEAVNILKEVVRQSPNVALFNYHLGMSLYKTGDEVSAKTFLTNALSSNSNFPGKAEAESQLKNLQ